MSAQDTGGHKPPASPFRQKVAEELIKRLEQGTAPWQHFVKPGILKDRPYNPASGTVYRGGNEIWLSFQPFDDPRWMTYRQAHQLGAQVKKGARGTQIEFWKTHEERIQRDEDGKPVLGDDGTPKKIRYLLERPIGQRFTIFNASQIEGLERYQAPQLSFDPIERAEAVLAGANVSVLHDTHSRAFYQSRSDEIHLPKREHFKDASAYYSTALHELGHATGHSSRLNRDLSGAFGSEKYAREELRAEISSLMVAQTLGIGHDPGNHAAYVASWIKVLRDDPNEIFRAARDAEAIQTWVIQPEKRPELQHHHAASATLKTSEAKAMEAQPETEKTQSSEASRVYLSVNFSDKEAAKSAGAKWDRAERQWYAPPGADVTAFAAWLPSAEKADEAKHQPAPQLSGERAYLAVPYSERRAAKEAGAKWDAAAKSWYAPPGAEMTALTPWLPPEQKPVAEHKIDPQQQFAEALRARGLLVDGLPVMDGQWHRVPVEGDRKGQLSGSYRGFLDGLPAGQITNFKAGLQGEQWVASGLSLSDAERAQLAAQAAEAKATRDAQVQANREAASKIAYGLWKSAPAWATPENSPYLAAKGVRGYGVKVDEHGRLMIPLRDGQGRLHNLQTIDPQRAAQDGLPAKMFLKNGQKVGLMHLIDPKKELGQHPLVIAEGYATAATLHEATRLPVVVAFDSGNLKPVAEALRAAHPEQALIIAGDNDHHLDHKPTGNTGLLKASEAAQAVGGTVIVPTLSADDKAAGRTDFNDLAQAHGLEAVRAALTPVIEAARQHAAGVALPSPQPQKATQDIGMAL